MSVNTKATNDESKTWLKGSENYTTGWLPLIKRKANAFSCEKRKKQLMKL